MDTGAIERLAERMQRSRAQEATIAKQVAEQGSERQQTAERRSAAPARHRTHTTPPRARHRRHPRHPTPGAQHDRSDDDFISPDEPDQRHQDRVQADVRERVAQHQQETKNDPVNIKDAKPEDIHLDTRDLGDIQLAYSGQLYDLQAHTGEPTYVLFGGWQTEQQLGFVTAVHSHGDTDVSMSTEDRNGRDIETELRDRIGQVIERSQSQEAATTREASSPEPDRECQPAQLEPDPAQLGPVERDSDHQPERDPVERDPYIEQAIQEAQERQQAWEQGIEQELDNDRWFGIE